jgi:hypothetical protein
MRTWGLPASALLLCIGCGSGGSSGGGLAGAAGSAGAGGSAASAGFGGASGAGGQAGEGGSAGGAAGSAGASACEPAPGDQQIEGGCDMVDVAVIDRPGETTRLQLRARIIATDGCALLDQVILGTEQSPLVTIDAGGVEVKSPYDKLLDVDADPALQQLCGDETQRYEPFGFVAKGRMDGGTFIARCGKAGFGSGYPPHVLLTCHSGIAEQPRGGSALIEAFGATLSTQLYGAFPHPPDDWMLVSASTSIRIIPGPPIAFSSTPPISPFDTTGWTAFANETLVGGLQSQLQFFGDGDKLGTDLCPAYDPNDPLPDPSPVFLMRVSGQTNRGPFTSEISASYCTRPFAP